MKDRKKVVLFFIISALAIVFIVGISYALWQITLQQEGTNIITTGCFKVEFTDNNPINLDKAYPISDEEGMSLVPYEFTITNTCDSKASFQINLEILNDTTLENLNYIKVMLDEEKTILTSNESVTKTLEEATSSRNLETEYLDANASKTFLLRLWLDENTPTREEFMNKTFLSKITIISSLASTLDSERPVATFTVTRSDTEVVVDASEAFDSISNIKYYYYSTDGENYIRSKESSYTFPIDYSIEYGKATETIHLFANSIASEIYMKVEDEYGNMSEVHKETLSELAFDNTADNNLRYIGSNPNNYIDIGDRDADGNIILWRIIGVMNNIRTNEEDEVGVSRLKLVRAESIGEYSWDSSDSSVNDGYGVNEWSQADAMTLLNDYYYNSKSDQTCYNGRNNATTSCDFSSIGLSSNAKSFIEDAVWNTGTNGNNGYTSSSNGLASHFYDYERSDNTGKICSSGISCNDSVTRTTKWKGKIGLMYLSDYGYATGGGSTINREACLSTGLYNWGGSGVGECHTNDWLYNSTHHQWTLGPICPSPGAVYVICVSSNDYMYSGYACSGRSLSPTLFLKASVKINEGEGTTDSPFTVTLE